MKKILFTGFIILIVFLIRPSQADAAVTITNPNLKYFGYYVTQFDPGPYETFTSEMKGFGNSNVVRGRTQQLYILKNKNLLAIVSPSGGYGGYPPSFENFLTGWNAGKQMTQESKDLIYAFYFDEPFWKHRNDTTFPTLFKRITQKIHTDFPDKAIMITEAWPMFGSSERTNFVASGLTYVTDIGVDCYYTVENCSGTSWDAHMTVYNKMKSIASTRKIWLIPDGYATNSDTLSLLKPAFENYFRLANTDPQIVGMLNFVYGNPTPSETLNYTLRQVLQPDNPFYDPALRARQIEVGKAIVSRNPVPDPVPGDLTDTGDTPGNQVNIYDYNLLVANFGKTGSNIVGDIDNNGKVDIFDYNILVGNIGR